MNGLMMDMPLLISDLIRHADRHHGDTEIVSKRVEGDFHRYTYRDAHTRSRRLAKALAKLGVGMQDRVATLAWNGYRHFEIYYAVAGSGAVIHTINPRLFPEQVIYIANHAEDEVIFVDKSLCALLWPLVGTFNNVKHIVVMDDGVGAIPDTVVAPQVHDYETLLASVEPIEFAPLADEHRAAAMRPIPTHTPCRWRAKGSGKASILSCRPGLNRDQRASRVSIIPCAT